MKDTLFKTIGQFVFLILGLVFCVSLTLGITLDFSKLADPVFWFEVIAKLVICTVSFNLVFEMDSANKALDKNGRFYNLMTIFRKNVERLFEFKLYDKFASAVERKNEEIRTQKYNRYLHRKGSARVSMCDLEGVTEIGEIEDILKRKLLDDRAAKRCRRAIAKILNGQIRVKTIDPDDIIIDKVGDKLAVDGLLFSAQGFRLKANAYKTVGFLGSAIAISVISSIVLGAEIFQAILTNAVLILSSVVSALQYSKRYILLRSNNIEERNHFFSRFDVFNGRNMGQLAIDKKGGDEIE